MKKDNVLQYAVAITGIILGYHAIESLLVLLLTLVSWLIDGGRGDSLFFPSWIELLFLLCKALLCWLLIMRSGKIAAFINDKANIDTQLAIATKPATLLQVLFVTIGMYFLVLTLPNLLNDLLDSLREKNGIDLVGRAQAKADRFVLLIQIILAALVMGLAKPLSAYFARQMDEAPLSLTQNIDAISTENSTDTI
jgi:hypothetical protein